jgi:hypothetical protein
MRLIRSFSVIVSAALTAGSALGADAQPRRGAPAQAGPRAIPYVFCNSSTDGTFVGGGLGNYTGGSFTGVIAGEYNGACDFDSAIGGGYDNVIAGNGNAWESFIGAGTQNRISNSTGAIAVGAFIGAGQSNTVSVGDSGIVAGLGNRVGGAQSFIGAGQYGMVQGTDSAIGAGYGNVASSTMAFVGAGYKNTASGNGAFLGGGGFEYYQQVATRGNVASGQDAFLGGGDENTASGLQSFVGAGVANTASGGDAFVGGGDQNTASVGYAFVGAGLKNTASNYDSFVGAGYGNVAGGNSSFVGAGGSLYFSKRSAAPNSIGANGTDSFIGAGDGNTIGSSQAFVGGGQYNTIAAPAGLPASGGTGGAIVGGYSNAIVSTSTSNVEFGFIGGGYGNSIAGNYGTVGGGYANVASGVFATVPGGSSNIARGQGSFAAGTASYAATTGSFVWSDAAPGAKQAQSTADNQFLARASGGVAFYTDPGLTSGVSLAPGSGTWASLSDRSMKTRIVPLDGDAVLARIARLPVSEWSYRTEDPRVRHVGPMAQDFYAAFHLGEDDRHITSIDEDGIALAAIKALHAENGRLQAKNAGLRARLNRLRSGDEARFAALEREIARLAGTGGVR